MRLDVQNIGEIQAILQTDDLGSLDSVSCSEITLPAAVDLSRAIIAVEKKGKHEWARVLRALFPSAAVLEECSRAWLHQGSVPLGADIHGTRHHELFPLFTQDGLTQVAWHPFEARFARSLKAAGFSSSLADGLVNALNEMADNVIQHSDSSPCKPARSVVGYCVTPNQMGFVICDTGRGALASLHRNASWTSLQSDREALCAIVEKQASRVAENVFGDGYRTMFRTLADHNALIRLRSRDGFYELYPTTGSRDSQSGEAASIAGFQVSVSCAIEGVAKEIKLC